MSVKSKVAGLIILLLLNALLIGAIMGVAGLSSERAESSYSGYVVDTEYERGMAFQTTQMKMKTHPRSSEGETFCIKVPEDSQFVEEARQALRKGHRVEITYSRPMYVPISQCQSGTSIVQDITVVNGTSA